MQPYHFPADQIGNADAVVVQGTCNSVTIREQDLGAATLTRYKVYAQIGGSYVQVEAGLPFVFTQGKPYHRGDIAGYVEILDVASTEFAQIEG